MTIYDALLSLGFTVEEALSMMKTANLDTTQIESNNWHIGRSLRIRQAQTFNSDKVFIRDPYA